jgi:hypothetical protein
VKVTLFQESDEKSEPTRATPRTRIAVRPSRPPAQKFSPKLRATAASLRPTKNAAPMRPSSAPVLATVKMFWTRAPVRSPRVFSQVRKMMRAMATAFCGRSGRKTPRNLAKATATAAMVPVWITVKKVQP